MKEGKLDFIFEPGIDAYKYDTLNIYIHHLQSVAGGLKGVDFIAQDANWAWFIEVKDFRVGKRREDKVPLEQELVRKVMDTLVGLYAMQKNRVCQGTEYSRGNKALSGDIRLVFHIEHNYTQLFPRKTYVSNLLASLRGQLNSLATHVYVVDHNTDLTRVIPNCCWTVTLLP